MTAFGQVRHKTLNVPFGEIFHTRKASWFLRREWWRRIDVSSISQLVVFVSISKWYPQVIITVANVQLDVVAHAFAFHPPFLAFRLVLVACAIASAGRRLR